VHFAERKWVGSAGIPAAELTQQIEEMLTRYGFTHVFDTGSVWRETEAIRARVESGEVPGPKIFTAGGILFPKGGLPSPKLIIALGLMAEGAKEVATPEEAAAVARRQIELGADAAKVYAATWGFERAVMPVEVVRAAAREAHAQKKLLFAHPSNRQGIEAALEGGADILVHTAPESGPWDSALVARMKARNVALIPTLKLWRYETRRARASAVRGFIQAGIDQLRSYSRAGGPILFGTDVGYMADYDPADELTMMREAGMSFPEILASMTTAPAGRFGQAGRTGRIAPGMDADLVLLGGDPERDIRQLVNPRLVLRAGKVLFRR
jgi:imidazolonepropionase-like amidohydrolase